MDGERVYPRSVTQRDVALKLQNNHFCSIWKSEGVSLNQAIKDLEDNFKIINIYLFEENVKSHFECIHQPKKFKSFLTNFIVYDLETHNTDRARPNLFCSYRLSKIVGGYDRNLPWDEIENFKKDAIAIDKHDCVEKALDFCLKPKGEERRDSKNKLLKFN